MKMITQCCYCKKVKLTVDTWSDGPIVLDLNLKKVTHGACPDCFSAQMDALERDLGACQQIVNPNLS